MSCYGVALVLGEDCFFIRDNDQLKPSLIMKEFKNYAGKRWPHLTILWAKQVGSEVFALPDQDFSD